MSQKDGGHFMSGVPKDCFSGHNPCQMQADCSQSCVGEAGSRVQLEKMTARPTAATHPDDLDARQPEQTIEARAQIVS